VRTARERAWPRHFGPTDELSAETAEVIEARPGVESDRREKDRTGDEPGDRTNSRYVRVRLARSELRPEPTLLEIA
jgi:hypothetical protein